MRETSVAPAPNAGVAGILGKVEVLVVFEEPEAREERA
jgi:hypothetical protein